jgi:ABC-type amino acid transport system permease subunit
VAAQRSHYTLELSLCAWLLALALWDSRQGAMRTVPYRALRAAATFYVEVLPERAAAGVDVLLVLRGAPAAPEVVREWLFGTGSSSGRRVCALGVYSGARFSEVLRSGIQSIPARSSRPRWPPASPWCRRIAT